MVLFIHSLPVLKLYHLLHQSSTLRGLNPILIQKSSSVVRFLLFFVELHIFDEHIVNLFLGNTVAYWYFHQSLADYQTLTLLCIECFLNPLIPWYIGPIFPEDISSLDQQRLNFAKDIDYWFHFWLSFLQFNGSNPNLHIQWIMLPSFVYHCFCIFVLFTFGQG